MMPALIAKLLTTWVCRQHHESRSVPYRQGRDRCGESIVNDGRWRYGAGARMGHKSAVNGHTGLGDLAVVNGRRLEGIRIRSDIGHARLRHVIRAGAADGGVPAPGRS